MTGDSQKICQAQCEQQIPDGKVAQDDGKTGETFLKISTINQWIDRRNNWMRDGEAEFIIGSGRGGVKVG